jgi:hypothetical protein
MKNQYYITSSIAIDQFCAVKLAELNYKDGSDRNDDHGALYIAPLTKANWDAPLGLIILYATTNGDPIMLAQIEDAELTWFEETNETPGLESLREVLERANWLHPSSGEGYSFLVEDSL